MAFEKIKNWLAQFRKYYFTYSKGFWHLPYNGNSPETLVDSFKGLPFVQHCVERQCVATATPLMDGGFHYQKLEDGCWLVYSRMRYKANVAFDMMYDGAGDSDYYMLSLNRVSNSVGAYISLHDGHVIFPKYSWTFFKPKVRQCSVNFKGDDSKFITLFFNEAWLRQHLASSSLFEACGLSRFIDSQNEHILWPLDEQAAKLESFDHFEEILGIDTEIRRVDLLQLKLSVLNLIFDFLRLCEKENVVDSHREIDYQDRFSLDRVADYLRNHLCEEFPGIPFLAEKFDISQTRLKDEFKQQLGKPVYQYFQEQQMILARALLADKRIMVKEIAYRLGYASPGKFSAAFKKHHGILPSEL